jgi:hypothetical protein
MNNRNRVAAAAALPCVVNAKNITLMRVLQLLYIAEGVAKI